MGVGPISWLSIDHYCDALSIEGEQRELMHHNIRAMDDAYVRHYESEQKRKSKSNG